MGKWLALFIALTLPAQSRAAEDSSPLKRRQEHMRLESERSMRSVHLLPGRLHIQDVCRLRIEGGRMVLISQMVKDIRSLSARVAIDELPGSNLLVVNSGADRHERPDTFTLYNHNFTDPHALQVTTQINYSFGTLSIGRYTQTEEGYENITLNFGMIEDSRQVPPPPMAVQLAIQSGSVRGASKVSSAFVAADLATLRREHPREVEEYLRPMFRQFHAENLLAAEAAVAWQVLQSDLPPDPASVEALNRLLPRLDADSYRERQQAMRELQAGGDALALAMKRLDRTHLTDQQLVLIDTAMAHYFPRSAAEVERLRASPQFLLDCLYCDDLSIRKAAAERLNRMVSAIVNVPTDNDADHWAIAVEQFRLELSKSTGKP